jgi:hypothetical protein
LSAAPARIEVTVRPTDLIAAEQIKSEEKQRLIGVIPNLCTSYIYDAAPLTWKQKFSLAARGTFDPASVIREFLSKRLTTNASGYGRQ